MNNLNKYYLIFVLVIFFPFQLWADGNELLEHCLAAEKILDGTDLSKPFEAGLCMGTVRGVRDTMSIMTIDNNKVKVCFPENSITNGQSVRVVNHYLKNNPSTLHENEILLVMKAYLQAYPCK